MSKHVRAWQRGVLTVGGLALTLVSLNQGRQLWASDEPASKTLAHTSSSPIAVSADDKAVWSVNPDNDSVSVFNVERDANHQVAEIKVGKEPWCVVLSPYGDKAYVTNMASGTVSVIDTKNDVIKTIHVGAEPFGCALKPDGGYLYVTNQSSDSVSVINTRRDVVIKTIPVHLPRVKAPMMGARAW